MEGFASAAAPHHTPSFTRKKTSKEGRGREDRRMRRREWEGRSLGAFMNATKAQIKYANLAFKHFKLA